MSAGTPTAWRAIADAASGLLAAAKDGAVVAPVGVVDGAVGETELNALLLECGRHERNAFYDRGAGRLAIGLGVASRIDSFEKIESTDAAVAFVAWRFDVEREPAPEWAAFGRGQWVIPDVYLVTESGQTRLGISTGASGEDARSELTRLRSAALSLEQAGWSADKAEHRLQSLPEPKVANISVSPTFHEWSKSIASCLQLFADGEASKVVLGRRTLLSFEDEQNPADVFGRWCNKESGGYAFFVEREDAAFLGVTPELLWRGTPEGVALEAVAGTRPRGETEQEDQALAQSLLDDDKERREHDAVRDFITERVPGCSVPQTPQVRKLRHVQHLVTPISAPRPNAKALTTLAPTPAVCGVPRDRAFAEVARLEAFDRGLYAGGVGLRVQSTEVVAVGIRSVLLRANEARIYAGAGLVAGSVADNEWREIGAKERGAKEALGLPLSDAHRDNAGDAADDDAGRSDSAAVEKGSHEDRGAAA